MTWKTLNSDVVLVIETFGPPWRDFIGPSYLL